MDYIYHLIIFICIYSILAQSLNIFSGYTNLLSLAHAGFYGIGAYTSAIFSIEFNFPILFNFFLAPLLCFFLAFFISLIALRTYEDYFVIVTLGIQVTIFSLMNNLIEITNGPLGISAIPSIKYFDTNLSFMILTLVIFSFIYYLINNFSKSHYAMNLKGIKDDEIFMLSIGKNVKKTKVVIFSISASIASIAGVLYAHYISYIDPSSFTIDESIFILSIVIIGGLGNIRGAIVASIFMILLPEILRFVGFSDSIGANLKQIIYGAILILVIFYQEKWKLNAKNI